MIEIKTHEGDVSTIIAIRGLVDARGAGDLEAQLNALLEKHQSRLIIDFEDVELLTSAGIRVLVTIERRLTALHGSLVLCGLNANVQRVLEVSGLASQFTTASSRVAARGLVARAIESAHSAKSALGQLLEALLSDGGLTSATPDRNRRPPATAADITALAGVVEPLLTEAGTPPA